MPPNPARKSDAARVEQPPERGLQDRDQGSRVGNHMPKIARSQCDASFTKIIEDEILPRLVGAHSTAVADPLGGEGRGAAMPFDIKAVVAFARACIGEDPLAAQSLIDQSIEEGAHSTDLFLGLITPAARHLGELWEQDYCDFASVTIGLARLHEIAHRLGYVYQGGPQASGPQRRLLLTTMPGSQHLLGLIVVADFFRRADWEVVIEIGTSEETILETIQHEWFELIGLSVSTERECKTLNSLLLKVREMSRNPTIRVILGGPVFTSTMGTKAMEMAAEMGVLGCCSSAPDAVALAGAKIPVRSA